MDLKNFGAKEDFGIEINKEVLKTGAEKGKDTRAIVSGLNRRRFRARPTPV